MRDLIVEIIKIDQSVFIIDLVIKNENIYCNANGISIKAESTIKMTNLKDYED